MPKTVAALLALALALAACGGDDLDPQRDRDRVSQTDASVVTALA